MKKRGFTLVELVLVIAILGITAGTLGSWLINSMTAYDTVTTRKQMLTQLRTGFERMILEIMLIPAKNQIIATNASSFTFNYPTGTSITYALSGTNLMRNADIAVPNVTALAFTYYDEGGNVTVSPANVRSVSAQISARTANSAQPYTIRTRVFIRSTGNYHGIFATP